MDSTTASVQASVQLGTQIYYQWLEANRLRRAAAATSGAKQAALLNQLAKVETDLADQEQQQHQAQQGQADPSVVYDTSRTTGARSAVTTGLDAVMNLRMAQVPTAIYHLLDAEQDPLVDCTVYNRSDRTRRLRVTSFIEGYSAQAVNTQEVAPSDDVPWKFGQLPTLFPERIRDLTELTRATLNVLVEDLDRGVETHATRPIWLLARNTAPLWLRDPKTGGWRDLTPYLGAFVTPNAPSLLHLLRAVAQRHPSGTLQGYQGPRNGVKSQVKAIYDTLKEETGITYVDSLMSSFTTDDSISTQRVRLPRESLADREANCVDGAVLFASLLEAASLSPALVFLPGHALVAWETWRESNDWRYLETTYLAHYTFEGACVYGKETVQDAKARVPEKCHEWPLRDLRTTRHITPME